MKLSLRQIFGITTASGLAMAMLRLPHRTDHDWIALAIGLACVTFLANINPKP